VFCQNAPLTIERCLVARMQGIVRTLYMYDVDMVSMGVGKNVPGKDVLGKNVLHLVSLVKFNIAPRTLRSSDQHLLYLPRTCTVTGGRAFNLAAPKIWNSTNLHSLLSFYRLIQTAPQNFLLLFSFSLTSSSHAGPAPRASDSGPRP
jgi:hypothetical protein